jgi:GT2 family glycosyltransferase
MSDSRNETVAAVVVTYNRRNLLAQCVDALLAQSRPVDAIYVVDNASTDGTPEMIASKYAGRVIYERLSGNIGGAGGFHHGMKRAYEEGYDWIWVMDDDVVHDPDCLKALLEHRASRILVPVRLLDNSTVAEGSAIQLDLQNPLRRWMKVKCVYERYRLLADLPDEIELEDFSFEGPLFHRSIPERMGFPLADFFYSFDDTEYACRARFVLRERIVLIKGAHVFRLRPATETCGPAAWRQYCFSRNMLAVRRIYGSNLLARWAGYAFLAASALKLLLQGEAGSSYFRILLHAALDSLRTPMPLRYRP